MAALARAVAELLVRGGWLTGLAALEFLLLAGFWWSGPTPFGDAFDRRAAEADLLLLTLATLPPLFAGALLASGDREDGMADFFRACRVSAWRQVAGTGLGLFLVTGGALVLALPLSLLAAAPPAWTSGSVWLSLALALALTAVHGAWGLALGSWCRSRWAAVAAALGFWVVTLFALEALVSGLTVVLPARGALPAVFAFTALDPSALVRVVSVTVRGQAWAYGPAFAEARTWAATLPGAALLTGLGGAHLALPLLLAVAGWHRRVR